MFGVLALESEPVDPLRISHNVDHLSATGSFATNEVGHPVTADGRELTVRIALEDLQPDTGAALAFAFGFISVELYPQNYPQNSALSLRWNSSGCGRCFSAHFSISKEMRA